MNRGDVLAGRFEIDALVGEGGMGRVYRAFDGKRRTFVAVKVLAVDLGKHAVRFEREANMLRGLSGANIVRHLGRGTTATGHPFFVMEWLDGEDLSKRIARNRLTLDETLTVIAGAATALMEIHAQNIVHRDVKPSNIFLIDKQFEHVKLLDLGIAKCTTASALTTTGRFLGTPAYMAPEQIREGFVSDPRVDVFSLGCVFYECLTQKPAFTGKHWFSVVAKVLTTDPPRLRDLRPDVPSAVEELVTRMMAKEPAERPRDGAAIFDAIAQLRDAHEWAAPDANAMTNDERRSFSLLLARRNVPRALAPNDTLEGAEADLVRAWQQAATNWGGRLGVLPDGMVMITMSDTNVATDNAARAARCALWLRENAHADAITLTTCTGHANADIAAADAIDQAAMSLLTMMSTGTCPIGMDEITARLLDARFDVREMENGALLVGERENTLGARLLLGKSTPCIGRERELAILTDLFHDCLDEHAARAALVLGAAGMGKSRILQELLSGVNHRHESSTIWIGCADALRMSSTLGLLAQVVRNACGIRGNEPLAEGRIKISSMVERHVQAAEQQRVSEFLGEMVGLPFPDASSTLLRTARRHAQTMADEMRRAWIDFLRAESTAQPLLLLLEDLHWGDEATVRFIDAALDEVSDRPWMVVATARPEIRKRFPKIWASRHRQEITLQPLGKKACERLASQVLGEDIGPQALERIIARADGNAFYLEELIRHAAAQKNDELPTTIVTMVQSRLALLEEQDRRTLRAAAILGEAFCAGAIAALLGGPEHTPAVARRLNGLVEHEVLVRRTQSRFGSEPEFAFRHVLLREGAYATLTDRDRSVGHKLAGEWLEAHGETDPALLARHFERAGEGERAALHHARAAE